ncbi:MAG TPA: flagellar type III secretion system pore protein FliP [Vicinamibacterales bacterium]|jgi:flagellar biosynthetic protein FliP|nr:flagellar type III secretion system pore protein FliP [Vicinamibacterales bacterium]
MIRRFALIVALVVCLAPASTAAAAPRQARRATTTAAESSAATATPPQNLSFRIDGLGAVSAPLQIVVLLTLLTFVPAALIMMTSFTRISIVFHFLRQALGTPDMPSNQMLIGLTLFLTAFIMAPTAARINEVAVQPALAGSIDVTTAMDRGAPPLRDFMLKQTREADLALFVELARLPRPASAADLPMRVVVPAFAISELKTGFQMGFFLFVPFLLVDLVVSTTLLSMGMMQLPPMMISLPFKVLLFVMIDGWNLLVGSLVKSFM